MVFGKVFEIKNTVHPKCELCQRISQQKTNIFVTKSHSVNQTSRDGLRPTLVLTEFMFVRRPYLFLNRAMPHPSAVRLRPL